MTGFALPRDLAFYRDLNAGLKLGATEITEWLRMSLKALRSETR